MIVPIPQGQSWQEASWTEPEGFVLQHKSHSRPSQWIQVGGSFEVRYDYEDSDGNIIECVFTVTGVEGRHSNLIIMLLVLYKTSNLFYVCFDILPYTLFFQYKYCDTLNAECYFIQAGQGIYLFMS